MKKKGFTLIELLVVIAIIAMLMAILMPALSKVKKIAARVVCGTNLKGLGTAQVVYSNDYDDEWTVQGRGASGYSWGWQTTQWQIQEKSWDGSGDITVGASLYLLVREADVSPKSFVCPSGDEKEFAGKNDNNLDIVDMWDFGNKNTTSTLTEQNAPRETVSYSFHQPYGSNGGKSKYAADGTRSAAFAVMADKNPYFDPQLDQIDGLSEENWTEGVQGIGSYWDDTTISESSWKVKRANAQPHDRDSQNVLFADGHTANERVVDVGVKNDNIYVPQVDSDDPSETDRRKGDWKSADAEFSFDVQPVSIGDSYLVNDDSMTSTPE